MAEIEGFPKYLIYDDGRIWSKKYGKFLIPQMTTDLYHRVGLYENGNYKKFLVHRLVALHYIPNPENKPEVDHKDHNRTNNQASNLRWVTTRENQDNKGDYKTNTSGHKYISYSKRDKKWIFSYPIRGHRKVKYFKTKQDALCYKYIFLLKVKSGIV